MYRVYIKSDTGYLFHRDMGDDARSTFAMANELHAMGWRAEVAYFDTRTDPSPDTITPIIQRSLESLHERENPTC